MFDSLAVASGPTPRRGRRVAILSTSIALHAGAIAGLIVSGLWTIEKLGLPRARLSIGSGLAAGSSPPPGGQPKPEMNPAIVAKKRERKVNQNKVQPTDQRKQEIAAETSEAAATSTEGDGGPGPGGGGNGNDPLGLGKGFGDGNCEDRILGCPDGEPPQIAKEVTPPPEPLVVSERVLAGHRTRGNDQIHPPDPVRVQMLRDGKRGVRVAVKLCLNTRGSISSVQLLQSSGYAAYDRKIVAGVRGWRYSPYRLSSGKPVPVCSSIVFNYVMK